MSMLLPRAYLQLFFALSTFVLLSIADESEMDEKIACDSLNPHTIDIIILFFSMLNSYKTNGAKRAKKIKKFNQEEKCFL